jgi:hypothetical protein
MAYPPAAAEIVLEWFTDPHRMCPKELKCELKPH